MKRLISFILALMLTLGFTQAFAAAESVKIERIDFNNPGFIRGMDISSVISLEKSGVKFFSDGAERDIFAILAENGVNYIRVRVWNNPFDEKGNGYGGGNNDVETAAQIGKRAAENGMKLLVDFHYSDFWADPAKQKAPKQWESFTLNQKAEAIKSFTLSSLKKISAAGADIGMVQIGNETTSGIAGETDFTKMPVLFKAGAGAVREFDRDCRVALHFTNPEKTATMKWLADYLAENKVDYDVFATSYYPYYHGSLENLTEVLAYAAEKYNKLTMVAETSYPNTLADTDGFANTVAKGSNDSAEDMKWSFTPQGQADEVRAVMDAVNRVPNGMGLGVFYWEGAWITVGDTTNLGGKAFDERLNANRKLWEQFGSGWASSYAAEYDSEDAGKWYGGSSVDNQAFFAPDGSALPSLSVFRDVCGDLGDTNHDGKLNIRDATAIQKHLAGIKPLDSAGLALADFNRDGKTDVADATAIQKTIAGI